jgi:hypothetical protein
MMSFVRIAVCLEKVLMIYRRTRQAGFKYIMQEQATYADLRYREHAANLIAYPRVSEDEARSP